MPDWIILRTSGRNTLALAQSLKEAGFECWTPAHTLRRRKGVKRVEMEAPLLPTWAFADAGNLERLLALSHDPPKPIPGFSVFHELDRIPLIEDSELVALRETEAKRARRNRERQRRAFNPGEQVRVDDGPWTGMSGIVETMKGNYAMVFFPGGKPTKIATFLLHPASETAAA